MPFHLVGVGAGCILMAPIRVPKWLCWNIPFFSLFGRKKNNSTSDLFFFPDRVSYISGQPQIQYLASLTLNTRSSRWLLGKQLHTPGLISAGLRIKPIASYTQWKHSKAWATTAIHWLAFIEDLSLSIVMLNTWYIFSLTILTPQRGRYYHYQPTGGRKVKV